MKIKKIIICLKVMQNSYVRNIYDIVRYSYYIVYYKIKKIKATLLRHTHTCQTVDKFSFIEMDKILTFLNFCLRIAWIFSQQSFMLIIF